MVMEDPYEVLPLVEETRTIRLQHREAVREGFDTARAELVDKATASLEKFRRGSRSSESGERTRTSNWTSSPCAET